MELTLENKGRMSRLVIDIIQLAFFVVFFIIILNKKGTDIQMTALLIGVITVVSVVQMYFTNIKMLKKLVYNPSTKKMEMFANLKFGDAQVDAQDISFIQVMENKRLFAMRTSGRHFLFIKYNDKKSCRFDIFDDDTLAIANEIVKDIKE